MYKIGDVVKGNKAHVNKARAEHQGVIVGYSGVGYWITWIGAVPETHYADPWEIEPVYITWFVAENFRSVA